MLKNYQITNSALYTKIVAVENKIPNVSKLITNSTLNTKVGEVEKKVDVRKLVTSSALNTKFGKVENNIPNHDVYITTPEFNKLRSENFAARLK